MLGFVMLNLFRNDHWKQGESKTSNFPVKIKFFKAAKMMVNSEVLLKNPETERLASEMVDEISCE